MGAEEWQDARRLSLEIGKVIDFLVLEEQKGTKRDQGKPIPERFKAFVKAVGDDKKDVKSRADVLPLIKSCVGSH